MQTKEFTTTKSALYEGDKSAWKKMHTENPNLTSNSIFTRLLEQGEKYIIRNMDTERFEKLMTHDKEKNTNKRYSRTTGVIDAESKSRWSYYFRDL